MVPARTMLATVALAIAATLAPRTSGAQSLRTTAPVPFDNIVSVNPVLLVFSGIVSADYERRIAPGTTLGASLSSFSLSDANYLTVEGRARYYIEGRALEGFSVGGVLGYVRLRDDSTRATSNALNIGFTGERQWLLGVDERLALTAGLGATRIFLAEDRPPFRKVLPVLRLSVGWGF
jgi:hypothetical protein